MADGEEKQYPATQRKRDEARKKGQVARSNEFGPAVTLLVIISVLHALLPNTGGSSFLGGLKRCFDFQAEAPFFGEKAALHWGIIGVAWAATFLVPIMLAALAAGTASGVAQVGFNITPEALAPQWNRVDPAQGIKRLLSTRGSVELLKGIAKMGIIGLICFNTLRGEIASGAPVGLMRSSLGSAMSYVGGLIWTLGIRVCATLFIMAAADYAYQRYEFEKNLKMTASELKQEMRQSEGDPQIKGKIRRLQREMAKRRMMQDVPTADVVVTNPTHLAVALKYEAGGRAPRVVAKGPDLIAQQIKDLAREHRVPLVENVPLARQLYRDVEIGQDIPGELYEAVAKVLAYVYRVYGKRRPAASGGR